MPVRDGGLWLMNGVVEDGSSGGPVYLQNGLVIGVMVVRFFDQPVAGFVPARYVMDLLVRAGTTPLPKRPS